MLPTDLGLESPNDCEIHGPGHNFLRAGALRGLQMYGSLPHCSGDVDDGEGLSTMISREVEANRSGAGDGDESDDGLLGALSHYERREMEDKKGGTGTWLRRKGKNPQIFGRLLVGTTCRYNQLVQAVGATSWYKRASRVRPE